MIRNRHAFTLIEMLVVIAIIGIVAALVVNLVGLAKAKKYDALISAEKQGLMTMIDSYHAKLNYYPPDNGFLATLTNGPGFALLYDAYTASNPLLYELAGATNNYGRAGNILVFDGTTIPQGTYPAVFNRSAVNNANPDEPHLFFLAPANQIGIYNGTTIKGLIVPAPASVTNTGPTNFWHYDASSAFRHNMSSYDLWAEYSLGGKNGHDIIITNGNW